MTPTRPPTSPILQEIKEALPKKHPVVDKLRDLLDELTVDLPMEVTTNSLLDVIKEDPGRLEELMYSLGDWMRGVRDWSDVERLLRNLETRAGVSGEFLPRP
jgi:hypothetical protein